MKRGIIFPDNLSKPQWVWLVYENPRSKHPAFASLDGHLQPSGATRFAPVDGKPIQHNATLGHDTGKTIYLWYRDESHIDGSRANRSVLAATQGLSAYRHCGPIVITPTNGHDLTLRDYKHIVDFLSCYDTGIVMLWIYLKGHSMYMTRNRGTGQLGLPNGRMQGVRINWSGDQSLLNLTDLSSLSVPKCHLLGDLPPEKERDMVRDVDFYRASLTWREQPHNSSGVIPVLSSLLGILLSVWKVRPSPEWAEKANPAVSYENSSAMKLFDLELRQKSKDDSSSSISSTSASTKRATTSWFDHVGSLIVVRLDRKDLSVQHVEALCAFAEGERYKSLLELGLFEEQRRLERQTRSLRSSMTSSRSSARKRPRRIAPGKVLNVRPTSNSAECGKAERQMPRRVLV